MPWGPQKAPLTLTPDERKQLQELANFRTAPFRDVQRASILLAYADGIALRRIAQEQGVTRMTVDKCIKKALSMGVEAGLKDLPPSQGSGHHSGGQGVGRVPRLYKACRLGTGGGNLDAKRSGRLCPNPCRRGRTSDSLESGQGHRPPHSDGAGTCPPQGDLLPRTQRPRARPQDAGGSHGLPGDCRRHTVFRASSGPYRERGREAGRPRSGACLSRSVPVPVEHLSLSRDYEYVRM